MSARRFWKCPNGADCKYRHALPPDYVLKSQMKELLEEEVRSLAPRRAAPPPPYHHPHQGC